MSAYAFLGAGEFEDWHADIDRSLLEGRSGPVLVFATASAPEGDEVYQGWIDKGLAHYAATGIEAVSPPLRTREDANDPAIVAHVDEASTVFFSGGNPAYLAKVLLGTPVWQRIRDRVADGSLAYAGCSAGVACLSDPTFDSAADDADRVWAPGLGHFPEILFAPHWDIVETWIPGAHAFIASATPAGGTLVAIDEQTALVGDGTQWSTHGVGGVYLHRDGSWVGEYRAGDRWDLPMLVAGVAPVDG
jgi:cyanophycinase-like exopeptidase